VQPQLLRGLALTCVLGALALAAAGQAPPGYYASVDSSSPGALRSTLHAVIDDHVRFPYTAASTDTWDILEAAQQDPADAGRVLVIYKNASYAKWGGGNSEYEREHSWPKSYGFPDDGPDNYPYTDCHLLFLADSAYNAARSNKPFRACFAACQEWTSVANGGQGGGSGAYPGNSNWTAGSLTQGTWEVWRGRRGDIARAMFYADVRYEGGVHNVTGAQEPDLILTDSEALIAASNTGQNLATGHMGMLAVLLEWHADDPVDAYEMRRNDEVFSYQGNRNPFVDHPEWVRCVFEAQCSTPVLTYCTAKVNSCGTTPTISAQGDSSVAAASGFVVRADQAQGKKAGLLLYTDLGIQLPALPFDGGWLCISGPKRANVTVNPGAAGTCDGLYAIDVNAYAHGLLGGNPKAFLLVPGTRVNCQWWGRDTQVHGSYVSDALQYTVGP
jgi:endonuclease I